MASGSNNGSSCCVENEKPVMVIGIDDSEHSLYALDWTLDRYFVNPQLNYPYNYKLVIVHARLTPSLIGVGGPVNRKIGSADFMNVMETDFKRQATRTIDKVKEICKSKSVDNVVMEVVEGDPRNVICETVDKYHASILVVGSHGYGVVKRAVLGSVSDYCAHHAHCTVMIVKRPLKNIH